MPGLEGGAVTGWWRALVPLVPLVRLVRPLHAARPAAQTEAKVGQALAEFGGSPAAQVVTAVTTYGSWSGNCTGDCATEGQDEGQILTATEAKRSQPGQSGVTDSQIAVLVVQVGWALDDAAHDLPAGRMTPQRREELADTLQALGFILRASAPDGGAR
ncbi:MAG: hypothetical protein ACRDUV_14030 [Pseudonocardiaceae bacterium]